MKRWTKLFRQKYQSVSRAWKPALSKARKNLGGNELAFTLGCACVVNGVHAIYPPAGWITLGLFVMSAAYINARMRK